MPENKRKMSYVISFKNAFHKTGQSAYQIQQETGVRYNTIRKYQNGDVNVDQIGTAIAVLCDFCGVDFHDVVSVQEVVPNV